MIMTISLFIILLAFFILLNAIAVVDENKTRAVLGSLIESFNVFPGGQTFIKGEQDESATSIIPTVVDPVDVSNLFVDDKSLKLEVNVRTDQHGTILSLPEHLLFDGRGAQVKGPAKRMLQRLAAIINKNDYPVRITGHMDNTEPPPDAKLGNRELSSLRAVNVFAWLVANGNVNPARVTAYGWDQYHPLTSNATKETRALNRRIDVRFIQEKKTDKPRGVFTFKDFFFKVRE